MSDDNKTITVKRVVNASPKEIWEALTQPEQVAIWWGPRGFTSTIQKMDVKPGGSWDFILHGPNGVDYPNSLSFDEVEENKRLTYIHHESTEFGLAAWNAEITIVDLGGKSEVVLTNRFASEEEKAKHVNNFKAIDGANQTLERLANLVESPRA